MSASFQFPQISLTDVFQHLAAERGAGVTVVTPNRRLASALKRKFDDYQVSQKVAAWESVDMVPFAVFIERLYQDALYSASEMELPILLTTAQARVLWESIINDSDQGKSLLSVPQTAELAYEAWQLAHAWQLFPAIRHFPLNEDGRAFNEWAHRYRYLTKQNKQIDVACLCDLLTTSYAQLFVKKPTTLVCYGFEILTPQQISFLEALVASGCDVRYAQPDVQDKSNNGQLIRISYVDTQSEIYHAAIWARARIEADQTVQVGVVVPALSSYRSAVMRIFKLLMSPDIESALPGKENQVLPFNVSLGMALTSYPLIDTLFQLLALLGRRIEYERVSLLLRSPFINGAEDEMGNRALLDAQIRKNTEPDISIKQLIILIKRVDGAVSCPRLMQTLSELVDFRSTGLSTAKKPSEMIKIISGILKIAGFPGERVLDSTEYQTLQKWHEVAASFSLLDSVISTIHYSAAVSRLYRLAAETLFQPETPDVPIQILGVMEAAGMQFEHLWVMGLSDEAWPLHPRPNPFLPIELQRQAKLPFGSSAASYDYSQKLTKGWLSCSTEVVLSYPERSDDRDGHALKPSSLIKQVPVSELELPVYENHLQRIQQSGKLEYIIDDKLPVVEQLTPQNKAVSGGVAVIRDYAACPFRAMAKHRLKVASLTTPHVGLNAIERGMLIHDVLAQCWKQLVTKAALDDASDAHLEALIVSAVAHAIHSILRHRPGLNSRRFVAIEQRRLLRLARAWLDEEKKRNPFAVVAIEEKHQIQIGGLQLSTRLDRIDQLADGRLIIIDYKAQKQTLASLLGERLDEPQLPLYLVTVKPESVAIVFAQVKIGAIGFVGAVRDEEVLPGVKAFTKLSRYGSPNSWEALVKAWQQDLTHLATGFFNGHAQVGPKNVLTCKYCDMQPFCRIHERARTVVPKTQQVDDA